jgi:hypothetical protein
VQQPILNGHNNHALLSIRQAHFSKLAAREYAYSRAGGGHQRVRGTRHGMLVVIHRLSMSASVIYHSLRMTGVKITLGKEEPLWWLS